MMKNKLIIALAVFTLAAIAGCHRSISGNRLTAYIADPGNGLTQQKQSQQIKIIVQYLPSVYELWQDISQGATYSKQQADSVKKQYDAFYYFRMVIRNIPHRKTVKDYFNFGIRSELLLICRKDTIPCSICQRIINGNSNLNEYLIAFPRNKKANSNGRFTYGFQLLYTGNTLGISPSTFHFTRYKLNKIPALKFNQ